MNPSENQSLQGKVVLVTGASRGIGAETARRLAAAGARVVCSARTLHEGDNEFLEGSLEGTVTAIRAAGGEAEAMVANLAEEESCAALVGAAEAAFGPVDVLVNNAAVGFFGPMVGLKPSRWNLSWRVTVSAPIFLSQLVLPSMIERGGGRIVNVSSESAIGPGRGPHGREPVLIGDTAYGAQKAAIERFTQGLAIEVEGTGVGVAAVAPSQIVPTPGALFNRLITGPEDPKAEKPAFMPEAIFLLATLPLEEMSGRIVYSQRMLLEQGQIEAGSGLGFDGRPLSGYALR
jgi:NAD(P)-dependent dehydrogenase (short-subunit alcohol dehydrogenase family)